MSASYIAAYGSLPVPAILAGVIVSAISLQATFEISGSVVAFEAWLTRPARPTPRTAQWEVLLDPAS